MDAIERLVNEAHDIFNQTSVFEVVDADREYAVAFLNKVYNNPPMEAINRYLAITLQLRNVTTK